MLVGFAAGLLITTRNCQTAKLGASKEDALRITVSQLLAALLLTEPMLATTMLTKGTSPLANLVVACKGPFYCILPSLTENGGNCPPGSFTP